MDCWIVIGCANYKILALGPIGLPRQTAFSTYTAAPLPLAGEVDALDRARRVGGFPPLGALLWQGTPPPTPPPTPARGAWRGFMPSAYSPSNPTTTSHRSARTR